MSDEDLTTAYMTGYHKRDDEVAALKAEIERLRHAVKPREQICATQTVRRNFLGFQQDTR